MSKESYVIALNVVGVELTAAGEPGRIGPASLPRLMSLCEGFPGLTAREVIVTFTLVHGRSLAPLPILAALLRAQNISTCTAKPLPCASLLSDVQNDEIKRVCVLGKTGGGYYG